MEYKMNLQKAIEILEDFHFALPQFSPDDRREAVKLGIEALKLYRHNRLIGQHVDPVRLPGETDG